MIVDKWVYGGEGLARIDGRVVFVPAVLPGETARIDAGDDVHARLLDVLTPAPERVPPPCPLFTICGGCHYQHAPYEYQLARKVEILREQLQRVGKIKFEGEIGVISGPPLGYRNRAQFHVSFEKGGGKIGYLAARSHELVPVEGECPVSSPRLNLALSAIRDKLSDPRFPRFVQSVEIFTNETDVQINVIEAQHAVARRFYDWCESRQAIDYQTSLGTFRVSSRSFFQVNRFLAEKLVETALPDVGGESALDLYAGVGLFALRMARRFKSVTAVESGSSAAHDLEFNASRAELAVKVDQARVEDYLARLQITPEFVLADPPRAGLGKDVVAHLVRLAPPRMTIVSCDPATLARDLAGLTGYRIDSLTLVDLFPQTFHLEAVVRLTRIGG
ncbi:MAG TPA: class I SAM-dependent RNA methyltransferase [Bryobacteraceae bacterium]|nr:class I SAM-dependent RNA methyltransferase [Bryobacteraceae bacterium]